MFVVSIDQIIERNGAVAGVVHIGRETRRAVSWPHCPGHKTGFVGVLARYFVGGFAGKPGRLIIQFIHQILHVIISHGNGGTTEGVGLDNVRTGLKVLDVNLPNNVGAGQRQQVVVPFYIMWKIGKTRSPIVGFGEIMALDHGAHCTVENQNTFVKEVGNCFQQMQSVIASE